MFSVGIHRHKLPASLMLSMEYLLMEFGLLVLVELVEAKSFLGKELSNVFVHQHIYW